MLFILFLFNQSWIFVLLFFLILYTFLKQN